MAKSSKPKKAAPKTVALAAAAAPAPPPPNNATPRITEPLANEFVPPGVDLQVLVTTNRGDLRYKVVLTDSNPPPGPVTIDVPAPGGADFTAVFDASHLQADRVYEIHVFVDPADGATPPHMDHAINVHTTTPPEFVMVLSNPAV